VTAIPIWPSPRRPRPEPCPAGDRAIRTPGRAPWSSCTAARPGSAPTAHSCSCPEREGCLGADRQDEHDEQRDERDLAAADVTGDGNDDLVIGDSSTTRPGDPKPVRCVDPEGDTADQARPVGMLHVLRGSAEGLTVRDASSISGLDVGIEDDFGHYLAADHFRHGPYADVVVYGGTRRGGLPLTGLAARRT
jgi:hypothetical protein